MEESLPTLSVFTLQGLGNTILSLPILLRLVQKFDVRLYLMHRGAYDFFKSMALPMELFLFESPWNLFLNRIKRCEIAVSLYPNWKREMVSLWRCKANRKISFFDPDFQFTRWFPGEKLQRENVHDLENNAKIFEALGVTAAVPFLDFKKLECFQVAHDEKLAVIHPTASTSAKFYPEAFWSEVIEGMLERGFKIRMVCGSAQREHSFARGLLRSGVSLEEGAPLLEVAKSIAGCGVFIGLDSSLAHLAALLGKSTLVFWSTADFRRIHPYGDQVRLYLAREVFEKNKSFELTHECAKARDALQILDNKKEPSFTLATKFTKPVLLYAY